jgi:TonB family protein
MRIIHSFIAVLLVQVCVAQQTQRKVNYLPGGAREIYYVLTADETTLHGRYQRTDRQSRTEGFYKNGQQDGMWTEYILNPVKYTRVRGPFKDGKRNGLWTTYADRKKLSSRGSYQDDKRTGTWRFFDEKGELESQGVYDNGMRTGTWTFFDEKGGIEQEFDYTARKLVNDNSIVALAQTPFKVINGSDTLLTLVDRPPVFIGGKSKMVPTKIKTIRMDKESMKVQVLFTVDKTGRVQNCRLANPGNTRFDYEAYDIVMRSSSNWIPATLKGEPVAVEYSLTVEFRRKYVDRQAPYFTGPYNYSNTLTPGATQFSTLKKASYLQPRFISYQACSIHIL